MTRHAITGAMLFDGTTDPPRPGTTVAWEGDRIAWVGPDGEADLDGYELTPAPGAAVLPGLIDAHVHICLDATVEGIDGVAEEPIQQVRDRSMRHARKLLDVGITAARDQGSTEGVAIDVARAQRNGEVVGARIFAAGRGLTPTGGHGWMIGVQADGPEAIRAAVASEIERGADIIKLFPTGGVLGSGSHGFAVTMSAEELQAAVEEAHRHGLLVGAHIHGRQGIDMALDAGIDTIEHATDISSDQARCAAAQGVALVPTLSAGDVMRDHADVLPAELLERMSEVGAVAAEGIRKAIAVGARVLAGTDAGTPFNPPGGLVREMILLAGLGLGNRGAIAAATSLTAQTLRLDGLGVIAAGNLADLIVADGNPENDLGVLAAPRMVVQGGVIR